jgi:hypothetical protein
MSVKVNSSNPTPGDIAFMIKSEKWGNIEEMDIDNFVYEVSPKEYAPKMGSIIQSRTYTYDPGFVERQVRKSNAGFYFSEPATLVYFPEETVIDDQVIPSNSYRLVDRTHGMVIDKYIGKTKKTCNIVNYKHDLNSDPLSIFRCANKLNETVIEQQGLEDDAIKNEIYRLMDQRISEGKDAKPSDEERQSFFDDYPQIDEAQWRLWVSYHTTGGRRSPNIQYSKDELQATQEQLKKFKQYEGYVILAPRTIKAWTGEAIGSAVWECCEGWVDGEGKKVQPRKVLIPLYASNQKQCEDLKDGRIEARIKSKFKALEKFLKFDALEYMLLQY